MFTLATLITIIALLAAVTIHEFAHAFVATRLGDPTPQIQGRVSLNPLRHIDPLGTFALIFFHFGWGKPVQFNPHNLRRPTRDSALIALAGPAVNILTAILCAIPLKYLSGSQFGGVFVRDFIQALFEISIYLFALNILPFPPFDGSKIVGLLVPFHQRHRYERFLEDGVTWVLIFILFDQIVVRNIFGVTILGYIVGTVASAIFALVGLGS